ncbi:hypothetical protein GBAR_LOCUS16825, partial [Geodia barretti]
FATNFSDPPPLLEGYSYPQALPNWCILLYSTACASALKCTWGAPYCYSQSRPALVFIGATLNLLEVDSVIAMLSTLSSLYNVFICVCFSGHFI